MTDKHPKSWEQWSAARSYTDGILELRHVKEAFEGGFAEGLKVDGVAPLVTKPRKTALSTAQGEEPVDHFGEFIQKLKVREDDHFERARQQDLIGSELQEIRQVALEEHEKALALARQQQTTFQPFAILLDEKNAEIERLEKEIARLKR